MTTRFRESHTLNFVKPIKTGKVWDVILIESGISRNNKFYSEKVLTESAHLFEGARAGIYGYGNKFDHVPGNLSSGISKLTKNIVGWFTNVRFDSFVRPNGSKGKGLLARFNIFDAEKDLQSKLHEAFVNGQPNLLGLSIDAEGSGHSETVMNGKRVLNVGKIERVQEVTIVSDPSAGGGLMRLVASMGDIMKNFYMQMCAKRSGWLKDFAVQDSDKMEDKEMKDHVIRILESNLENAKSSIVDISSDEVNRLAAHGRGIKSINDMLGFVKTDNLEGAMRLIESWSNAENLYELPFDTVVSATTPPAAAPAAPAAAGGDADRENKLAIREAKTLVRERLLESDLPKEAHPRITMLFDGKASVNSHDVDVAISTEKAYIARLKEGTKTVDVSGGHSDSGEGNVEIGDDKRKKYEKAWDGFFNGGRAVDGVIPFRGLKEAFGEIHGIWASPEQMTDWIFKSIQLAMPQNGRTTIDQHIARLKENWNGMAPFSLRESITTSDFTVLFGDALFRRLQKEYTADPLNDWRQIVSSIENLSDATNDFNIPRIGGQTILPVVAEGAPYQEGTDPTELNEKITPLKRGRILKLTWEDVLADRVGVLRRMPRILARSSNRTIQQVVFDEIESNPSMADGNLLISSGHINEVSGSPALSGDEFNNAVILMRDQTEQDSSEKLGLSPWRLLTGPKLESLAVEITDSRTVVNSGEDATVTNANTKWGVTSMMSIALGRAAATDDHWWLMANPADVETIAVGFLGGRDTPDMFVQGVDTPTSGSFFDADEITFKVRLVVGAKVVDWRGFVGSLQ